MALNLPPVPSPRPGDPAVTAALAVGVRLDDPFPQLYRDDRAADEEIRQVVASLRAGLVTVDEALAALALTGGGSGAAGVSVQQLADALEAKISQEQLENAVDGFVRLDPTTQRLAPTLMPQSVTEAVADRIALTVDGKLPLEVIPDGIGGTPGPDSIGPTLLTPDLRTQIASGNVGDFTLTPVKLAPVLGNRVKVPEFVPQDQTTALDLPTAYVRATSPTITKAQTGLSTIYWPYLVRVPDSVYAQYPEYGRWRVYCSTDHDSGAGGVACLKTDALRPGDPDTVWTSIRVGGSPKVFLRGGGDQIETPTVVFNPATNLFHLYYQIQGAQIEGAIPQRTEVATSADGITGWSVIAGSGIVNPPTDWLGWRHTGYAKVWLIDGQWVAWTLSGGGDTSTYGWAYSNDGIYWNLDRRRILTAGRFGGPLQRLGVSTLTKYRGQLWAFGLLVSYASGATGDSSLGRKAWCAPMRDDLLAPAGRIQAIPFVFDAGITPTVSLGSNVATAADGSLWSAYRTGDANSSIRFMEVR